MGSLHPDDGRGRAHSTFLHPGAVLASPDARARPRGSRRLRVGRASRGAARASRRTRGGPHAALLLRARLVADLNERAVSPA